MLLGLTFLCCAYQVNRQVEQKLEANTELLKDIEQKLAANAEVRWKSRLGVLIMIFSLCMFISIVKNFSNPATYSGTLIIQQFRLISALTPLDQLISGFVRANVPFT